QVTTNHSCVLPRRHRSTSKPRCNCLEPPLEYAEAVLYLVWSQALHLNRKCILRKCSRIEVWAQRSGTVTSTSMEVDSLGLKVKEVPDPYRRVIDGERADARRTSRPSHVVECIKRP